MPSSPLGSASDDVRTLVLMELPLLSLAQVALCNHEWHEAVVQLVCTEGFWSLLRTWNQDAHDRYRHQHCLHLDAERVALLQRVDPENFLHIDYHRLMALQHVDPDPFRHFLPFVGTLTGACSNPAASVSLLQRMQIASDPQQNDMEIGFLDLAISGGGWDALAGRAAVCPHAEQWTASLVVQLFLLADRPGLAHRLTSAGADTMEQTDDSVVSAELRDLAEIIDGMRAHHARFAVTYEDALDCLRRRVCGAAVSSSGRGAWIDV